MLGRAGLGRDCLNAVDYDDFLEFFFDCGK